MATNELMLYKDDVIVGIDLGTTNSAVAIIKNGKPIIVENQFGQKITPSVVAYKDGEFIIGEPAKRQMVTNPNTIMSIKTHMGSNHQVEIEGKKYRPEDINAKILENLKEVAEKKLGHKVKRAVISVPAHFNNIQRGATKIAAQLAGLTVEKIISEPTAAALAYGLKSAKNEKIMVFDLGGGTLDVSILHLNEGNFRVLSIAGDNKLGGDDFRNIIVDWVCEKAKKEYKVDLWTDKVAIQRIIEASEKAKIELSSSIVTTISLPFITMSPSGPINLELDITRDEFNKLSKDLLKRITETIEDAITESNLTFKEINEVILVGGSTRIPAVHQLVSKLSGKELNRTVNPDEAVVVGAAVQAGIVLGQIRHISLLDVTSLTLSTCDQKGNIVPIIRRNTPYPCIKKEIFTTVENNQSTMDFPIFQGEFVSSEKNNFIGTLLLENIEKLPMGETRVDLTFKLDENGVLTATATDIKSWNTNSITIADSIKKSDDDTKKSNSENKRRWLRKIAPGGAQKRPAARPGQKVPMGPTPAKGPANGPKPRPIAKPNAKPVDHKKAVASKKPTKK